MIGKENLWLVFNTSYIPHALLDFVCSLVIWMCFMYCIDAQVTNKKVTEEGHTQKATIVSTKGPHDFTFTRGLDLICCDCNYTT